jgi:hypothetical protein
MPASNETLVEPGRGCYTTDISFDLPDKKVFAFMKSTILSFVLVLGFSVPAAAADGPATGSKDAFVLAGDIIIPQIANGGNGFFMNFQMVNVTNTAATVTISFFGGDGMPMSIPYTQDGSTVTATTLTDTIAPRGIEFARTNVAAPTVQIGYARVQSSPENSIAVSTAFNQVVPGRPLFQSFVPLSTSLHNRFFVPFTNTGSSTSALAIVSLVAQTVTIRVRNNNGTELCGGMAEFPAGGHLATVIETVQALACSANANGVIEVSAPAIGLSGFGITAEDSGAFVTQPVYGEIP